MYAQVLTAIHRLKLWPRHLKNDVAHEPNAMMTSVTEVISATKAFWNH